MIIKALTTLFIIVLLACNLYCQDKIDTVMVGTPSSKPETSFILTGTVMNANTHKPISGVHIYIGGLVGGNSDENGKYFIHLNKGINKVVFRHITMHPKHYVVNIYQTDVLNVEMIEKVFELDEVVISSKSEDENVKQPIAGLVSVSGSVIKSIPALVGEPDLVKSLQYLPGITSVGEGSAGLNIRGGKTDQNLLLLNDAILLNANHAIGFLSPYNTDAVDNFDLYKGAVPSTYGGRSASTLNVQMKKGNLNEWRIQLSPGISVSKIKFDGPLVKDKISLLFAGRISNTNWLLKAVQNENVSKSSIDFNDTYTSLSYKINQKNSIDINLLTTKDRFQFSNQYGYDWSTLLTSLTYRNLVSKNGSFIALFSYGSMTNSSFDLRLDKAATISNGFTNLQFKASYQHTLSNHSITTGTEAVYYNAKPETTKPNSSTSAFQENSINKDSGVEMSLFISDEWTPVSWFSASVGARYSSFSQLGPKNLFSYDVNKPRIASSIVDTTYFSSGIISTYNGFEPRIAARISLGKNNAIKVGYSRMYQYLHSITNTTSPTPIDIWHVSNSFISPQKSDNYSIGFFRDFKKNIWSISAEFFYRATDNQLDYKNFAELYNNPHIETELINTSGKSYGFEFLIKKNTGLWSGWLAYTFSRSFSKSNGLFDDEKINFNDWYPSNHDRPHSVSLIINKKIWPNSSFNFTTTYTSGRPISIIDSYYSANGTIVPNYSNRNQYRIPDYVRVDVSFTIGNIIKKIDDSLVIGVYNLFGFRNAYSVFYEKFQNQSDLAAYQLSLIGTPLPSLSYSITLNPQKK